MEFINDINRSIINLKDILASKRFIHNDEKIAEYKTDHITIMSDKEIINLYDKSEGIYSIIGSTSALAFSVPHTILPINLHIIYLGFPSSLSSGVTKMTSRSLNDKILNLYNDDIIGKYDNLLIILPQELSENIFNSIQGINISLKEEAIDDNILSELKKYDLNSRHVRSINIFSLLEVRTRLDKHYLIPEHSIIRQETPILELLKTLNTSREGLPVILQTDIQIRFLMGKPGDICQINRRGESLFYRLCK
jgi:DNA-directed RNA polymerase subunit H (RpoH/RPB5)